MHLIRIDGRGPAGEDLYLHHGLTVLLGAPPETVADVVAAARSIGDPTVVAPAGLFEVDRTLGPIRALGAGGPDPVLELRTDHRPPPVPGPGADPGAEARRVAAGRIDELRSELDFVEGELRVAVELEQLAASGAAAPADGPADDPADRLAEIEAAADQVSLALLQDDPGGAGTELERRLRALVEAADDASVRAEAAAWRIDELAADLAEGDLGQLERGAEHSMLLGELEALRVDLLALDARGAVSPGDRERRAELEARASVLLGELGYARYVDLLLDDGSVVRPARRERVLDARRRLLQAELDRLRADLPGEVDARASQRERSQLQAEAAGLLGIPVEVVRRLTANEVADLIGERSGGAHDDGGLGAAVTRLLRALVDAGAAPPAGTGDPIEVLAAARRLLADRADREDAAREDAARTEPAAGTGGASAVDDLRRRAADLRGLLAEQERLLEVLVAASPEAAGSSGLAGLLPVGVPLAGRFAGESPSARELVHRVAALRAAPGPGRPPLVVLVDGHPVDLEVRILEAAAQVQCVVVAPLASPAWRAIGEDAGRVVEW
jgi:hypothetical protein